MYVYLRHAPGVLLFNKLCEKIYPLQDINGMNGSLHVFWMPDVRQLLWIMLALILQKLIYVRNL